MAENHSPITYTDAFNYGVLKAHFAYVLIYNNDTQMNYLRPNVLISQHKIIEIISIRSILFHLANIINN